MPETPTPGVNGQVVGSPALQDSMSMLSFAPAARMFGCAASTAIAGSFCLFCENTASLLPTVTSRSPPWTANAPETAKTSAAANNATTPPRRAVGDQICLLIVRPPVSAEKPRASILKPVPTGKRFWREACVSQRDDPQRQHVRHRLRFRLAVAVPRSLARLAPPPAPWRSTIAPRGAPSGSCRCARVGPCVGSTLEPARNGSLGAVFDHVGIAVSDLAASERFYRSVLSVLGVEPAHADAELVEWDDFDIGPTDREHPVTRGLHVGFRAPDRAHVDAFWQAGVDAGHPDDGAPGPRKQYGPTYYGGFLLDPDGNSVEAVHGDRRQSVPDGRIDPWGSETLSPETSGLVRSDR